MCLAVIALDAHPAYRLVVAANRDEFHARAASPAAWGTDAPFMNILAGRDLEAGGTWLGVRRDGRFALVTNVREGGAHDPTARSRGELVPRVLNASEPLEHALRDIADTRSQYNGFNLLVGDSAGVLWMSNRSRAAPRRCPPWGEDAEGVFGGSDHRSEDTQRFTDGIHGLSNALINTPWPKLSRTIDRMQRWTVNGDADTAPLFTALADREPAPDGQLPDTGIALERERLLSAPFIVGDSYGTRCSTVFTIDRAEHARFHERSFDADGHATFEATEEFVVA